MINPTELVINSPDYNQLMADGVTPRVSSFLVVVTVTVPSTAPAQYNIGKPTLSGDGYIHYSLVGSDILNSINQYGGQADVVVKEVGPAGIGSPSNTIHIERETLPGPASIDLG